MKNGKKIASEACKFAISGGLGIAAHQGLYFLLIKCTDLDIAIANAIGYAFSLVVCYFLNTYFTFKSKSSAKNGIGFLIVQGLVFLIHAGMVQLFVFLGGPEGIAPLAAYCVAGPANFLFLRILYKK